jgi:hypothetical protein
LPEPPTVVLFPDAAAPAPAQLTLSATALTFGTTIVGSSAGGMNLTVTNAGAQPSAPLAVDVIGDFAIVTSDCPGAVLTPGASCTAALTFTPADAGLRTGTFNVTAAGSAPVSGALAGNGLLPPMLTVTPTRFDFGARAVGSTSPERAFTVRNGGGAPAAALAAALEGAEFRIASADCPPILAPDARCAVNVTFAPASGGNKGATLAITSSAGRVTAALVGSGTVPAARLALTPASHGFGIVPLGVESPAFEFTVANTGDATSGALAITLGGADPGYFRLAAGPCTQMLTAGSRCTFGVVFAPGATLAAGARTAVLTVNASPGGGDSSTLTGNATSQPIVITPPTFDLGNVSVGATSGQAFTIGNPGTVAAPRPEVDVTGAGYTINSTDCLGALAPGASCQVGVQLSPPRDGTFTGTVTARAGSTATARITGRGINTLAISPAEGNFGIPPCATGGQQDFNVISPPSSTGFIRLQPPTLTGPDARLFKFNRGSCLTTTGLSPASACFVAVDASAFDVPAGTYHATLRITDAVSANLTFTSDGTCRGERPAP